MFICCCCFSGFKERATNLEGRCCVKRRSSKCRCQLATWCLLTRFVSQKVKLSFNSPSCTEISVVIWLEIHFFPFQHIWPSWLSSWPVTSWPKVAPSSPRSSAPKTTSHCSGSSSSSSRRCRLLSRKRPGMSLQRSLSSVRVSGGHWLLLAMWDGHQIS